MTPTYNERDNIEEFITRVLAIVPTFDVFIVDDNSPDGTGERVKQIAEKNPRVRLISRNSNRGFASACREGITSIINMGYDSVVVMDADLSHDAREIPKMVAELVAGKHLVIGSRYIKGGGVVNWTPFRRLLSRWGNIYTQLILGLPTRDCTSGFRAYHSSVIQRGVISASTSHGYAFQTEVLMRAHRFPDLKIVEVPITYVNRTVGESKMSKTIISESMRRVTAWGFSRLWRRK